MSAMNRWRAAIVREPEMFAQDTVRLLVADPSGGVLTERGLWVRLPEGERAPDMGLILPAEAIAVIGEAIHRFHGYTDRAAEAAVLREWLAVERERVDRVLRGER